MNDSREEFEAWVKTVNQAEIKWIGHSYANTYMAAQWEGWKAARAIASVFSWVSTKDRLPEKPGKADYEQIDCLVVYKGEVEQLMWNCEHLVWDDRSGDDFYCNPGDVDYWMPIPTPPKLTKQESK